MNEMLYCSIVVHFFLFKIIYCSKNKGFCKCCHKFHKKDQFVFVILKFNIIYNLVVIVLLKNCIKKPSSTDQVTEEDMRDLLEHLPAPMILLGDFNAHNSLWGSEKMSTRGRIMEKILDRYNLLCIKKRRNLLQSI